MTHYFFHGLRNGWQNNNLSSHHPVFRLFYASDEFYFNRLKISFNTAKSPRKEGRCGQTSYRIGKQLYNLTFYTNFAELIKRFLWVKPKTLIMKVKRKEDHMTRKKGKSVSFDAMVKFFMQYYNIPTKKDVDKLLARMDRLEKAIRSFELYAKRRSTPSVKSAKTKAAGEKSTTTSSDMALEVIKRFKKGVGFSEIQVKTGFGEKKLRNIIYRLHKMGKIVRKKRGVYIAS